MSSQRSLTVNRIIEEETAKLTPADRERVDHHFLPQKVTGLLGLSENRDIISSPIEEQITTRDLEKKVEGHNIARVRKLVSDVVYDICREGCVDGLTPRLAFYISAATSE